MACLRLVTLFIVLSVVEMIVWSRDADFLLFSVFFRYFWPDPFSLFSPISSFSF